MAEAYRSLTQCSARGACHMTLNESTVVPLTYHWPSGHNWWSMWLIQEHARLVAWIIKGLSSSILVQIMYWEHEIVDGTHSSSSRSLSTPESTSILKRGWLGKREPNSLFLMMLCSSCIIHDIRQLLSRSFVYISAFRENTYRAYKNSVVAWSSTVGREH